MNMGNRALGGKGGQWGQVNVPSGTWCISAADKPQSDLTLVQAEGQNEGRVVFITKGCEL